MQKYDTVRMSVTEMLLHDILLELQAMNKSSKVESTEKLESKETSHTKLKKKG